VRLFVLAKDASGLREVAVFKPEAEDHATRFQRFRGQEQGMATTIVAGFDLSDVMASHPAWFRIEAA